MRLFNSKKKIQNHISLLNDKTIGFVPTMGGLHDGHLKLIYNSKKKCDITICSIFINPTQFNNSKDFASYPSSLKNDLKMLEIAHCDIVYTPTVDDLYNRSVSAKKYDFGILTKYMEGQFRPGHFDGVATIVEKLFNIIKPTMAFFGEKDLQQLQVIKALVKLMNSNILIKAVPTVRESNGLAKSTRNQHLTKKEKEKAKKIYELLLFCKTNKNMGVKKLKEHITNKINDDASFKLEYLEFVALDNMNPIKDWQEENKNAVCIATYHSGIRLIDNIIL